jgi:aminopeptidase N
MMHDQDPFNRWQAAQTYATNLMTAAALERGDGATVTGKEAIRLSQALGQTAGDASLAPAYRAEFLKLPSESDIARELARHVDTDAVRQARETLRGTIANEIGSSLADLYDAIEPSGP